MDILITSIVALVAVTLGWGLAEATNYMREKRRVQSLKKALLEEINDCYSYLLRAKICLEEWVQLAIFKKVSNSLPVKAPTHIYDNYFAEIIPYLRQEERMSFNSIYKFIETIHLQYDRVEAMHSICIQDTSKLMGIDSLIEGVYANVYNAIVIIRYHIDHPKKLDLSFWTDDKSHKLEAEIKEKIHSLFEEAKAIGINEVIKKYNKFENKKIVK